MLMSQNVSSKTSAEITRVANKGPFIFYEIEGADGIEGGGGHEKKTGLKGGAIQKNIVCKRGGGVTQKITVKYCKNSIYDDAKFSTKMP